MENVGESEPGGSGRGKKSRVDSEMLHKNHDEFLEEAKPVNTKKSTKAASS